MFTGCRRFNDEGACAQFFMLIGGKSRGGILRDLEVRGSMTYGVSSLRKCSRFLRRHVMMSLTVGTLKGGNGKNLVCGGKVLLIYSSRGFNMSGDHGRLIYLGLRIGGCVGLTTGAASFSRPESFGRLGTR